MSARHLVILSPHPDDAAFSCGLLLWTAAQRGWQQALCNVFTHSQYAPCLETNSADEVSATRREEDFALGRLLEILFDELAQLDGPLRREIPAEHLLTTSLRAPLLALPEYDLLLAPFALGGHLDHGGGRALLSSSRSGALMVSIITPFKDAAVYLAEAIESVWVHLDPVAGYRRHPDIMCAQASSDFHQTQRSHFQAWLAEYRT
jgi:hypothetical protein